LKRKKDEVFPKNPGEVLVNRLLKLSKPFFYEADFSLSNKKEHLCTKNVDFVLL